jgi:hypothetical protein
MMKKKLPLKSVPGPVQLIIRDGLGEFNPAINAILTCGIADLRLLVSPDDFSEIKAL